MGLFKGKHNDDNLQEELLIDDELSIDMKPILKNSPTPNTLTADEIEGKTEAKKEAPAENPLESIRKKMIEMNKKEEEKEITSLDDLTPQKAFFNIDTSFLSDEEEKEEEIDMPSKEEIINNIIATDFKDEEIKEESVLENCMPFIVDGTGSDSLPEEKPAYTLDSVASILGLEENEEEQPEEEEEIIPEVFEETIIFDKVTDTHLPDISDIDKSAKKATDETIAFAGTIPTILNNDEIINTGEVDISEEFYNKKSDTVKRFEINPNNDDDDIEPEYEYRSVDDRKKIRHILLSSRRNRFTKFVGSFFALLILAFFALPAFSNLMLSFSSVLAVFTFISFFIAFICNVDMFSSLLKVTSARASAECALALSSAFSLIGIIVSVFSSRSGEEYYGIALMSVIGLTVRSFMRFLQSQYIYTNFVQISSNSDKYGIELIDDEPTVFAMARKAIDGDVLVAAPRRTANICNYMKNSINDKELDSNGRLFFFASLIFSVIIGIANGIYHSDFAGGIVSCCLFSALFVPLTATICNILPLKSAATHLNRYGSMLSSVNAAKQIEEANACVIDCETLFPKGTIKLSDMKILNENNIETTIAQCCAITTTIKSPLAPIFKSIMETNKAVEIPVADSIKYEEKLGITGWVGDKRIFIGNRALMLAHEIAVPSAENDKKLLRDGYFPIYVATDSVACAMLVVQYIPDAKIAKELDRISAMGLTILVNNCDQNLSEEMICDYFDLYSDSVKIMSGSGVHMYKTAVNYTENMNSGASVSKSAAAVAAVIYCANRVKKAVSLLNVAHIITIVLGVIFFAYNIFGASVYASGIYVAVYQIACLLISIAAYLFTKP